MTTDNLEIEPEELFYGKQEQDEVTPELVEEEEAAEVEQTTEVSEEAEEDSNDDAEPEETAEHDVSDAERVVDLDGREITVEQIKEWENGNLRQSDYTQKTQKLKDERREFEAGKEEAVSKMAAEKFATLDQSITELEVLIATDEADIEGLDEYDPEYIDNEKLKAKRSKALEKAKAEKAKAESQRSTDEMNAVQSELISNHPEWLDEKGEQTEVFKSELKTISEYFAKHGWSEKDQSDIKSARVWEAIIVAAKNEKLTGKVSEVSKKVRKLPVTTKPKKTVSSTPKTDEELFYGSK